MDRGNESTSPSPPQLENAVIDKSVHIGLNLALNKYVAAGNEMSNTEARKIVDGNLRTDEYKCDCCAMNPSSKHPWIEIDLQKPHRIKHITMYGQTDTTYCKTFCNII